VDDEATQWAITAARVADDKQGRATLVIDVGDVLAITEQFVITSAGNTRQVATIAQEIELQVSAEGGPKPLRVEGLDDLQWVLLDYGGFVVHVFLEETRSYYELERLWSDVPRLEWRSADSEAR
jgi:ribosome-associated protein